MKRTNTQNRALHLFFTHLSDELNGAGLDMKKTLKPEIDIAWTPYNIKEYLFRPIMKATLGKESTTQLDSNEIDKVIRIIDRFIGEKFGLEVEFPSLASLVRKMEEVK